MPDSIKVKAGTEIPIEADGKPSVVVVPADTILWSHGYVVRLTQKVLAQ